MGRFTAITLLLCLEIGAAEAYVRTTTKKSLVPVRWPISCITIIPDRNGSDDVSLEEVEESLFRSVENWAGFTDECSYMKLEAMQTTGRREVNKDDRISTLIFREEFWGRPNSDIAYSPSAIGLTTVFFVDTPDRQGDGSIIDADIEMNGVDFTFTTQPASTTPDEKLADLENTLTHEIGHVLGLAHNCWDRQEREDPPINELGDAAPDCSQMLPPKITEATMYPFASPGETVKRSITQDDTNGICDVYPRKETAIACYPIIETGCEYVPGRSTVNWWWLLLLWIPFAAFRQRLR